MKIFYTDTFSIPLPEKHSFPKDKYHLLRKRIIEARLAQPENMRIPRPATDEDILRALENFTADLVIYLAGADPYKEDRFGRLALTKEGLAQRDCLVFRHCYDAGLPVAVTMAGGYARNVQDAVDINFQTVLTAVDFQKSFDSRLK